MSADRCARASHPVRWIGQPTHPITGAIRDNWTQRSSSTAGTHAAPSSWAMTATKTGSVRTAPTMKRRVSVATSCRRDALSSSGVGPAVVGAAGAGPVDRASPSATTVPWIMFIPQTTSKRPGRSSINSTTVSAYGASQALWARSGKTTRELQSPSSCRSKTIRSGTPVRTWTTLGVYPPFTTMRTSCTPPRTTASWAARGRKKNQPSAPLRAMASTVTAIWAAVM